MKKILLFITAASLFSCGVTRINLIPLNNRSYDGVKEGVLHKDLGDPLIIKGSERYSEGVRLEDNVNLVVKKQMMYVYSVDLRTGEVLYYGGKDKESKLYFSKRISIILNYEYYQGIAINQRNKETRAVLVSVKGGYLMSKKTNIDYKHEEYTERLCDECFKQELIYNGKTGSSIRIIYREFNNNMARPDFAQNLTYDLSDEKFISFKGCKIKVIDAKNTGIDFKIISSFSR